MSSEMPCQGQVRLSDRPGKIIATISNVIIIDRMPAFCNLHVTNLA